MTPNQKKAQEIVAQSKTLAEAITIAKSVNGKGYYAPTICRLVRDEWNKGKTLSLTLDEGKPYLTPYSSGREYDDRVFNIVLVSILGLFGLMAIVLNFI